MSQQQLEIGLSLLDEVKKKSQSIAPEYPQRREAGLALINSDLQIVQQHAAALPDEEGLRLQALCLYEEAHIRVHFAAHEHIEDVNKTIRLLELAIKLGATEKMYFLLGVMCMELGRFDQARKALTAAKEC
ncbi:hypothetical protein, partial [Armatimonas sp.]|uniref:hypothetical protein n=1 Tax=Armatimonas sp. TaxID=1872638 RepID=UPI00286B72C9